MKVHLFSINSKNRLIRVQANTGSDKFIRHRCADPAGQFI